MWRHIRFSIFELALLAALIGFSCTALINSSWIMFYAVKISMIGVGLWAGAVSVASTSPRRIWAMSYLVGFLVYRFGAEEYTIEYGLFLMLLERWHPALYESVTLNTKFDETAEIFSDLSSVYAGILCATLARMIRSSEEVAKR